jgi:ribosome biogenesis GTPase
MLDRFLVITEKQKIPVVIVANKIDLVENDPKEIFGMYEKIGYRVIYTSTKNETGLEELRSQLQKKSAHWQDPAAWENRVY